MSETVSGVAWPPAAPRRSGGPGRAFRHRPGWRWCYEVKQLRTWSYFPRSGLGRLWRCERLSRPLNIRADSFWRTPIIPHGMAGKYSLVRRFLICNIIVFGL